MFALTLPGGIIVFCALLALERFGIWFSGHSWFPGRRKRTTMPFAESTMAVFGGLMNPGERIDRAEEHSKLLIREDDEEGAPPRTRVDLTANRVWLRPPE